MENVNKKGKLRGKKFVWFERMLRREGRKLCAVALCASMIIGNMAWPAAAANDTSGEYSFELSSESLFDAIQDAIAEGTVVDTELDLKGSAADEYQSFLEAGSSLYEIDPVIDNEDSDRDKVLDLRAFVRLENDIELDSAYVMDGSEEITFLLINSSDVYQEATISVDGRESETITVLPASAVAVDEEEAGPGVSGTANNSNSTITGSGSGSGGSGSSGGSNNTTGAADSTQIDESAADDNSTADIVIENGEIKNNEEEQDSVVEVQPEEGSDEEEQEPEKEDESTENQQDDADTDGTDEDESGTQDETGDVPAEDDKDNDPDGASDPGVDDNKNDDEYTDGNTTDGGSENDPDATDEPEDSDVTDDAGSDPADEDDENGTDESGNDNTADDQNDESGEEDEEASSDGTIASAVSVHTTYLLAASATPSDAEEATSSDASGLNGEAYETILLDSEAVVAYVTTAEELELDKIETILYTAELDDVVFSVEVPVGALPWGVELKASEYEKDSETYQSRYAETVDIINELDEEEDHTEAIRLFNVGFYDTDGVAVEPTEKVNVTITYLDADAEDVGQVVHFGEEGTEVIDVETDYDEDGNKNIAYELESFSDISTIANDWDNFGNESDYEGHIDVRLVTDSFEFTQTITESETQKITVTKVWDDTDTVDHSGDSVTVYLVDSDGNRVENLEGITLSDENDWTGYWEGLTLDSGDYGVEEIATVSGYTSSSTSVAVAEAGATTQTVTVEGSLEISEISKLTYTHNNETYELTDYEKGHTDTDDNGNTVYGAHFQNGSFGSTDAIALSDGDTITILIDFTATYTVYDENGNEITTVTNKDFSDYEYTETVTSEHNYCSDNGYDFYVYPANLLEEIVNEVTKTIIVTNTPIKSTESDGYIIVEKTFVGLSEDQIPENFQVTVGDYELTKNNYNWSQSTDDDGNIVWRWQINGAEADTYNVSESNADVENYTLSSEGANGSVTVTAADFTVTTVQHETTCSQTNWPVNITDDTSTFFAASLTKSRGTVIITASPLSASQKLTIQNAVLSLSGPWKTPVYFYNLEEDGTTFSVTGGTTITYDEESAEIILSDTSDWQHVATLSYSIMEADNPEIVITNTYTPKTVSVTVTKQVTGNMGDTTKEFSFTLTDLDGNDLTGLNGFTLSSGNSKTFDGITIGSTIVLTENSDGYDASATCSGGTMKENSDGSYSIEVTGSDDVTITVTNDKTEKVDAGVFLDSIPYVMLLSLVVISSVFLLFRRRSQ